MKLGGAFVYLLEGESAVFNEQMTGVSVYSLSFLGPKVPQKDTSLSILCEFKHKLYVYMKHVLTISHVFVFYSQVYSFIYRYSTFIYHRV